MLLNRRRFLGGAGAIAVAGGLRFETGCVAAVGSALTPEQFGAKGDGVANDTAAFARLAARVNAQGGGEVAFRRATYIVGLQRQAARSGASFAFEPAPILEFVGLTRRLVIRGNGARIKCARGLRYGTFDPVTGARTSHQMPYIAAGELAAPYRSMIKVEDCSGPVEMSDLELDGSVQELAIGGGYGDTGHQIPAVGLTLSNNRGGVAIRRLHSHHHPLDGMLIDGISQGGASTFEDVRCEYNGRQGCSIVGGRNCTFTRCSFSHTGRAGLASAPGAGVDIEAEGGKQVSGLLFTDCLFSDNSGAGMVADSGPSEGARFVGCTFIGTTNWAAWPNKPYFRFERCNFVGPIVHCFGDAAQPQRATQFTDCVFRDDPALSPNGQVYGGENTDRPIADLPFNPNVRFTRCRFQLTHRAVLPWTTNAVIFADCEMSQRSRTISYPRGTFVGRNRIDGPVTISSAVIVGELIVDGRAMPRGPVP